MKLLLYLLAVLSLSGCIVEAHNSYLPQRPAEPAFTTGKQFRSDFSFGLRHAELQASISPVKHLGTTFSFLANGFGKKSFEYGVLGYTELAKGSNAYISGRFSITDGRVIGKYEFEQHTFSFVPANTIHIRYHETNLQVSLYYQVPETGLTLGVLAKDGTAYYKKLFKLNNDFSRSVNTSGPPFIDRNNVVVKNFTVAFFTYIKIRPAKMYFLLQLGLKPGSLVAEKVVAGAINQNKFINTSAPYFSTSIGFYLD